MNIFQRLLESFLQSPFFFGSIAAGHEDSSADHEINLSDELGLWRRRRQHVIEGAFTLTFLEALEETFHLRELVARLVEVCLHVYVYTQSVGLC